jgi:hypothetical protein
LDHCQLIDWVVFRPCTIEIESLNFVPWEEQFAFCLSLIFRPLLKDYCASVCFIRFAFLRFFQNHSLQCLL